MKAISFFLFFLIFSISICASGLCASDAIKTAEEEKTDLTNLKILDLKTAGKIALEKNPSFEAAFMRVQQAKEMLNQARATYWPRLDASASFSHTTLSQNAYNTNLAYAKLLNPSATIDDPENYYNTGIRATWILFNGFERYYYNQAARFGKKQSEFAKDDMKRLLLSSVVEIYFSAQLALESIKISEADKTFNQKLYEEAKARSRQGAGSLSDEMNFEIRVIAAELKLLKAKKLFRASMFGLAAVLGMPNAIFPESLTLSNLQSETDEELEPVNIQDLINFALLNRSDIMQSESLLNAAMAEVKMKRAKFYPSVGLSAAYEGTRTNDMAFENDDFGNSAGVNVTYNLFSGGSDRARLGEAISRQKEVTKMLEALRLDVISDVRTSVETLLLAQKELVLLRSSAVLVKKNRDLVEMEYAAGQSSLVRLNEAQRDMITAQSRLALSLVTLRKAWFDLEATIGKISERYDEWQG
ncbi:MAG: TolC family protein [Deltaproteobacteria bacterium]|nr:TolC family protein [Deltaproteobacteria bacterium]